MTAARSGVAAARAVARIAAGAGQHAAWWLDHNTGGSSRRPHVDDSRPGAGARRERSEGDSG